MNDHKKITLVYDKECPACHFYCKRIDIEKTAGSLDRVDARAASAIMEEITRARLDIDQGMVLKKDGTLYYGADAINELAKIGVNKGWLNRLNTLFFRSRRLSRLLYPLFKLIRNGLLKLLRKTKINNLNNKQSKYF